MNLHSIAVYSDVDKNSKHVRKANESVHIGVQKLRIAIYLQIKKFEALKKKS
ncbi:MAG: hypothetical protein Ct9H300mP5_0990 [Candidatus Pelagibacterales bacterium]|nr:MAG: hypothetical protein Ct9H300mP5_0990 [Pelagibacterales bacterium]